MRGLVDTPPLVVTISNALCLRLICSPPSYDRLVSQSKEYVHPSQGDRIKGISHTFTIRSLLRHLHPPARESLKPRASRDAHVEDASRRSKPISSRSGRPGFGAPLYFLRKWASSRLTLAVGNALCDRPGTRLMADRGRHEGLVGSECHHAPRGSTYTSSLRVRCDFEREDDVVFMR